jgi:hypothetical protein
MTDDEAHRGSGKWVALATALIGPVGAAISAGLIHANSTPEASNGPAPVAVLTTITPAPSTSPSPPPSPSTSAASTWRSEGIAVCEAGQKLVGEVDEEDAVNEDKLRAVAPVISQMDQLGIARCSAVGLPSMGGS